METLKAQGHVAVSPDQWLDARLGLLAEEKQLRRQMDEVARLRRELPWERVENEYVFETHEGRKTLAELFAGRSQLMLYHFMFRSGLGTRMQRLFVRCRPCRRRDRSPCASGRHGDGCF